MDIGERLESVESEFAQMKIQLGAILESLHRNPSEPFTVVSPTMTAQSGPPPSEAMAVNGAQRHHPKIKPAPPSDFDGDRAKGRAFLNSCQLYFRLTPERFPDDSSKVHWALTYMKRGWTYSFSNRVLRYENDHEGERFATWSDFRREFIKEFYPQNEDTHALMRLETTNYFQGKRSADEYIDEFKDLIDLSGYTESIAIVLKFRKGLQRDIQDYIAKMMEGRPRDDDVDSWYTAASLCEENRTANAAFHTTTKPTFPVRPTHFPIRLPPSTAAGPNPPNAPTPVIPTPTPTAHEPMRVTHYPCSGLLRTSFRNNKYLAHLMNLVLEQQKVVGNHLQVDESCLDFS